MALSHDLRRKQKAFLPGEVDLAVLGHVHDVLLGAQLVLVAEDVLQVYVVLVEQGLHAGALLGREPDAQRGEDVGDNL